MTGIRGPRLLLASMVAAALGGCGGGSRMTFFVTSTPVADGGNIGGLAAADAHCQTLAQAAGAGSHAWRAYLSAEGSAGQPAVHARDRIGRGPWFNAQGLQIAAGVEDLHGPGNRIGGRTSLDEHGAFISSGAHDILTGSNGDGTLAPGDTTCRNWTSTDGHAIVGHSNKVGSIGGERVRSWNSAHLSDGCSIAALRKLGGGGLFYCFAAE